MWIAIRFCFGSSGIPFGTAQDTATLTETLSMSEYFDRAVASVAGLATPRDVANWITGDLSAKLNETGRDAAESAVAPAQLARGYAENGMSAYVELQEREFALEDDGYTATRHQREVGAGYFDEVAQVISGGLSSTLALRGSTEEAQFERLLREPESA